MMLVGLVVLVTAATGGAIGGLAWWENRATARTLIEASMAQTARQTAAQTARFLAEAETALRLGPELVARGLLDPGDRRALESFMLSLLAARPHLSWASYGDAADRFVGAWRDRAGTVYLNRSAPRPDGRIRLEEDAVEPDGRRRPVRRSDDHGYRPSARAWYLLAAEHRTLVWTEPYLFYDSDGLGITGAMPLLAADGRVRGVFTVDFSLDRLGALVNTLDVAPGTRVLVTSGQGAVLVGRPGENELVAALRRRQGPAVEESFELDHAGVAYLARSTPVQVRNLTLLVHVVVPQRTYTEAVDVQGRRATLLGLLALALAVAGGALVARWIARPLGELAAAAQRIRHGDLGVTVVTRSRDEIGELARAMGRMARALRDREFIREAFGRFVSPELARRFLRDRDALRLGGELREVTVLMSDLREFSALSERIGPEAVIGLVNRYLGRITPVILAHGGTVIDFIGDGILVLFGAPFPRPDDTARALHCALAMQEAVDELQAASRAAGLPGLAMGIAVHRGAVVTGNIGSSERVKYGAVGPPINVAARLQALAAPGEVLVTAPVLAAAPGTPVGPSRAVSVKGAAQPVTVYPLRRPGAAAPAAGG
jgi:sigma-B regulation protein RsbU (phosphoserine phosphatase)